MTRGEGAGCRRPTEGLVAQYGLWPGADGFVHVRPLPRLRCFLFHGGAGGRYESARLKYIEIPSARRFTTTSTTKARRRGGEKIEGQKHLRTMKIMLEMPLSLQKEY